MGKLKSVRRNTRRVKRTNVRRVKRNTVKGKKRHLRRKKTFKGGAGQSRKITITERNNYGNYARVTYTWLQKFGKGQKPILKQDDWENIKEAVQNLIEKLERRLSENYIQTGFNKGNQFDEANAHNYNSERMRDNYLTKNSIPNEFTVDDQFSIDQAQTRRINESN